MKFRHFPKAITLAILSPGLMAAKIYHDWLVIPICEFIELTEE